MPLHLHPEPPGTSSMGSVTLMPASLWAVRVPCAVDTVFTVVPVTCHSRAELLWQTQLSPACCFVYFCIFWRERSLTTFKWTPINDAHELHLCAETPCAYERCYFCKQFEGTASYGRILVSCAHSLIHKVCVHCECVCACVCMSKLSPPWRVQPSWPSWGVTSPWAPSCLLCTLPNDCALAFLLFKGHIMGAILLLGPW